MCDRNGDIPCMQRPCQPRERSTADEDDVNAGLKGRPVLYAGVVWIGIVRRFMIPRTCGSSLSQAQESQRGGAVAGAGGAPKAVSHVAATESPLLEPPLRYGPRQTKPPPPVPLVTQRPEEASADPRAALLRKPSDNKVSVSVGSSPLGALVTQVQEVSAAAKAQARGITHDLRSILQEGQKTTAEVIETVRKEESRQFRVAAISASGLLGYLAGLKRGVVTRLVYSATGATAMATICYPEETKAYNRHGLAAVHHWIVLGLSFVHLGPQKPLGGGTGVISNNTKLSGGEETKFNDSEQIQTNSFPTENIISNLMQNLGSLGHHLEDIKAKLKETSPKTLANESKVANESTKESEFNSAYQDVSESANEPTTGSLSHFQRDGLKNVSSRHDSDANKDLTLSSIPYSPALPISPEGKANRSNQNISILKKEGDQSTKCSQETPFILSKRPSEILKPRAGNEPFNDTADDEDNDDDDDDDKDDLQQDLSDLSALTFVVPTGGLELKLEGRQEHLKKSNHNINVEQPLNKKLTGYYKNIPEEQRTSREKGYDDAYSNRGR